MHTIGIDIRMMGIEHGGIGRYVSQLVQALTKLRQEDKFVLFHNREIKHSKDFAVMAKMTNTELVEVNIKHYSLREQLHFSKHLHKRKLDLVHFPNFNVPLAYSEPYVVTIHDLVHHKISGAKKTRLLHFFAYKKIIENAARRTKKIITVSNYSKADLVKYLHVPQEKIAVAYEGADLPAQVSEADAEQVKKTFFLRRPYFLFVGVMERKKNLVGLARGFDEFVRKYRQDMDLVIVGKADRHYPEIRHKMLDIKNSDRLVFTDYVADKDLAALYHGAYAFVSASLHEGFGLPGVEAMKFGLPLAVTNSEVFNEIYDNAAIYFNPLDPSDMAEKLNLLARDRDFRAKVSRQSLERSQLFDWRNTASQTWSAYLEALNQ